MYEHLDLSQEMHLVLPLDRSTTMRTDGKSQVFPDPHGMSGSPVWWLPDETNGRELPVLAAIVIEYHEASNALVATDVREAIRQMGISAQRSP